MTSRGFVYIKADRELMSESIDVIKKRLLIIILNMKKFDWTELKQDIRSDLEKFVYKKTNRRPVILPVVMEVNQNRHRAMQKRNEKTQSVWNQSTKKSNNKEK